MKTNERNIKQTVARLTSIGRQILAAKGLCRYLTPWQRQELPKLILKSTALSKIKYKQIGKQLFQLGLLNERRDFTDSMEIHHAVFTSIPKQDIKKAMTWVKQLYKASSQYDYYYNESLYIMSLFTELYGGELKLFKLHKEHEQVSFEELLAEVSGILRNVTINIEWLNTRHPTIQLTIVIVKLSSLFSEDAPPKDFETFVDYYKSQNYQKFPSDQHLFLTALIDLSLGNTEKGLSKIKQFKEPKCGQALALQATDHFLNGEFTEALKLYKKALATTRKSLRKTIYYFGNICGFFHSLCLLASDAPLEKNFENHSRYYNYYPLSHMQGLYALVNMLSKINKGEIDDARSGFNTYKERYAELSENAFFASLLAIAELSISSEPTHLTLDKSHKAPQHNLLAYHMRLELLCYKDKANKKAIQALAKSPYKLRFLQLIEIKEAWEYAFNALEGLLNSPEKTSTQTSTEKQLQWRLNPKNAEISVAEQRRGKRGQWNKGRKIALKRLYHQESTFDYLTPQDQKALKSLKRSYGYGPEYAFKPEETLLALIGHNNVVYEENPDVPIELVRGEPELLIQENEKSYKISLSHYLDATNLILQQKSMNQYKVINFTQEYVNIAKILSEEGLTVPKQAKDKLLQVIQNAKQDIVIHADVGDIALPEQAADATPCVQLLPVGSSIKASVWVKPTGQGYCKVSEGKKNLIAVDTSADKISRYQVHRDFLAEKKGFDALLKACPTLTLYRVDINEFAIEDPKDVLETLSELNTFRKKHALNIEWPEGESFKIKQTINAQNMSLTITSNTNWFEYDGEIKLSEDHVIGMQALLKNTEETLGRFIKLDDGQFLELSEQFYRKLKLLHDVSDNNKISNLGANALSDLIADVEETTFDEGWEKHIKKIRTMAKHTPDVPSTLQAELRDYQQEGFQYLSRLTHWGIGACLADDMGLGKTIQTISLILERAKKGPALVIAPTSVCFNWQDEFTKFAPSLNIYTMNTPDREKLVNQLKSFDVLICSYGLLHFNVEILAQKSWETLILDEAQAIKNPYTKRWKAVMQLQANNRIALTGTPIENHLGELWSIFSFINPGLLGNAKTFQNKYALPIESYQSAEKTAALKSLVQPYILRRTKSAVLTALPPKTEQNIFIEPSEEEMTFYEALRRNAVENLSELDSSNKRVNILAEIGKLRQACCDSTLVDNSLSFSSSKIKQFQVLVKNIIENGHKILVFSQYVRFLAKIKATLDKEKISYQYLDGSTTPAKRKKAVTNFQAGNGDVFLLSLKAGGSGLNLTAADYVIHLDPWWNPAVEDQASDRAHRIGQERPVTIYRLITKNTIEEKILSMHQDKRNLASELLSGQGTTGKLTDEELMNLIAA